MATIEVVFHLCDKNGCNKRFEATRSLIKEGITGYVRDNSLTFSANADRDTAWFACRDTHISGAISAVLERQRTKFGKRNGVYNG